MHPHGVIGVSAWMAFAGDAYGAHAELCEAGSGGLHLATVSLNFLVPLWSHYLVALGFIDASRASVHAALRRGKSVAMVIGGARESLDSRRGTYELTLRRRQGFVRLALEGGVPIVPCFAFGETSVYRTCQAPLLRALQLRFLRLLKFAPVLFCGRACLPLLPLRAPLCTVVGEPLEMPRLPSPSAADVARHHERYVAALQELFDRHKADCAPEGSLAQLVILH